MKKTHDAVSGSGSPLKKYQDVIVGRPSPAALLYFEWCAWLAPVPGALGMVLRKIFWPRLFGSCGRGVTFGANIVVRHPSRIHLGDRVVISEQCILDGRSSGEERTIEMHDDVILSNNVMLSCKEGTIRVGRRTGINAQAIIQSTSNCPVVIGDDCVIGQRCLIIGGGSYNTDRLDVPIREQGIKPDSGVVLANDVWLGGNVTVLGGVAMGHGSVAAAGAVVTRPVPPYAVCMGVPARVVKKRSDNG